MVHVDTKLAEELEADAIAYPDERGEILLEAADAWQRAGRPDRARAVRPTRYSPAWRWSAWRSKA